MNTPQNKLRAVDVRSVGNHSTHCLRLHCVGRLRTEEVCQDIMSLVVVSREVIPLSQVRSVEEKRKRDRGRGPSGFVECANKVSRACNARSHFTNYFANSRCEPKRAGNLSINIKSNVYCCCRTTVYAAIFFGTLVYTTPFLALDFAHRPGLRARLFCLANWFELQTNRNWRQHEKAKQFRKTVLKKQRIF